MKRLAAALALLFGALSLTACSDDKFDIEKLEGWWYMTANSGWELDDDEPSGKYSWDVSFPFNQPENDSDCEKMEIVKISENRYSLTTYEYYNGWQADDPEIITLDGNKLVSDDVVVEIVSLSSDKLVVEGTTSDSYAKIVFRRLE